MRECWSIVLSISRGLPALISIASGFVRARCCAHSQIDAQQPAQ
jgi:hypothetical protein